MIISLPTENRRRSYTFYQEAFAFEPEAAVDALAVKAVDTA
ncbi:hypothetical protein [Kribbella sp. NPDC006257]